ncbi:putative phage abortive infection protein [Aliarcobacter butzleri]|uniref:putative phage abortive infection protein n=1 Tax=Aliarcobacter butzleri TaxID=28197 RepID=UPI00263DEDBF|nr:putative phage abortive infection protein [Aliarcobacter butzleri]MDN5054416.1 putative phage abortive infection protein [Aliarcobacter butzleri]
MEEEKENLDNTNQSKSIYIILKKFGINIYKKTTSSDEWLSIPIMLIVMLFAFGILMLYMNQFSYIFFANDENSWSTIVKEDHQIDKIEKLGQVGDFIGGALNPLFALFSFILLLMTVKIQNKALKNSQEELKLTREELSRSANAQEKQIESIKIQNFENTFFNMINLHNEIIRNINFNSELKFEYDRLANYPNYKKIILLLPYSNALNNRNSKQAIQNICEKIEIFYNTYYHDFFTKTYDLCYENLQIYLGHYFGNIYQILKFISINKDFNDEEKRKYSDLFRAQFSSTELKLLFYHCTGEIGSKKFKKYTEEFKFFEHLGIESNNKIFQEIFSSNIYDIKAFDKNKEIIEFINIKKEENKKWLEEYNLKDEKEKGKFYFQAVKRLNYINNNILAINIVKKYCKNNQGNFCESIIEYLNKQIDNANTSSQEQQ